MSVSLAPVPLALPLRSEADILADAPDETAAYRFAPDPRIVVLQFPSLAEQGLTLNRVAALVEKRDFPHDRVLGDDGLASRIRASGATPETFYYGHDYSAAALVRFYALADRDRIRLTAEEESLRVLLGRLGWLAPGSSLESRGALDTPASVPPREALISLVRAGADPALDTRARATILRHELSHGAYFTDPAYAGYARRFWRESLRDKEREAFVRFLSESGYDPAEGDLMVNEMQAYLMHTSDPRYFNAAAVGLSDARLGALQATFLTGMPPGWLRDRTGAALPRPVPARAPRRRQGRGLVRRRKMSAATVPPCRAADAIASRRRAT